MQDEDTTASINPNTDSAQNVKPVLASNTIPDPIAPAKPPVRSSGGNTSGQGSNAVVPEEIKGWSWGAFLLSWIWGIGNSVWLALLVFVPFVNWVMPIVLGIKGREWAWQSKRWNNIEHFNRVQRKWAIAGVIWVVISIIISIIIPIIMFKVLIDPAIKIEEAF